eukprot:9044232-Alexandrium_andersonii.AAC.1
MSASLVGSEMCIRDSVRCDCPGRADAPSTTERISEWPLRGTSRGASPCACLLYTSDAADDM